MGLAHLQYNALLGTPTDLDVPELFAHKVLVRRTFGLVDLEARTVYSHLPVYSLGATHVLFAAQCLRAFLRHSSTCVMLLTVATAWQT